MTIESAGFVAQELQAIAGILDAADRVLDVMGLRDSQAEWTAGDTLRMVSAWLAVHPDAHFGVSSAVAMERGLVSDGGV